MLKEENGVLTADRDSLYPLIFGRCTEESQHQYETGKTSSLKIKDWVVVIAYPDFRVYDSRWMDDPELGRFCVTPDVDIAFSKDMVFPTFAEARKAVGKWWTENMAPETIVTSVENGSDEKLLSNEEIKQRFHLFNLHNDWNVFKDVPPSQQALILYPSVIRPLGQTDQEFKNYLIQRFGPLKETT